MGIHESSASFLRNIRKVLTNKIEVNDNETY